VDPDLLYELSVISSLSFLCWIGVMLVFRLVTPFFSYRVIGEYKFSYLLVNLLTFTLKYPQLDDNNEIPQDDQTTALI
jgi:hypothetical protein